MGQTQGQAAESLLALWHGLAIGILTLISIQFPRLWFIGIPGAIFVASKII